MSSGKRLLMLDVFRGLTIAGMILVNNPGSWSHVYAPLQHSEWHGCTPTDLIFPFFLIVVGIAIAYSFKKYEGLLAGDVISKILKRAFLIFLIGSLLIAFPFYNIEFSTFRVMGVLQRIGLVFAIAGILVWAVPKKYLLYITTAILVIYWLFYLLLGGVDPYALQGNLAQKVDLFVIGENHLYQGFGVPFDPEGLFSSLSAVATVLIGYHFGVLIKNAQNHAGLAKQLLILGLMGVVFGLLWGMVFPINKALWTSSYVLYSAGWAALLMASLIWLVDIKGYKAWSQPAIVFGVNPLFLYVVAWVTEVTIGRIIQVQSVGGGSLPLQKWFYENILVPWAGPINGSLIYALSYVTLIWLVGLVLYKKQIFIKI